jgi:hypothetical protein
MSIDGYVRGAIDAQPTPENCAMDERKSSASVVS